MLWLAVVAFISAALVSLLVLRWAGGGVKWFALNSEAEGQITRSALFIRDVALDRLRADRLMLLAKSIMPNVQVSDDYLWDKLLAADALRYEAIQVDNFAPGELEGFSQQANKQPNKVEHAA